MGIKGNGFTIFKNIEEAKKATPCRVFPHITEGEKDEVFNKYFGDIELQFKRMGIR